MVVCVRIDAFHGFCEELHLDMIACLTRFHSERTTSLVFVCEVGFGKHIAGFFVNDFDEVRLT
ncbi:MAG: hypothetical protein CL946_10035 [Ectothiorhodospiraceae bacterium]|nr:hypothetical protein [Ectothiorhodospiraceae bacterium]